MFNFRLTPDDAERVAALKREGIALASLVRSAIREEYDRLFPQPTWSSARELMERLYQRFPPPVDSRGKPLKASDRKSLQRAFRERMQANHRKVLRNSLVLNRKSTKKAG